MLCCSLIVKGSELGHQYLISKSESIQGALRGRRVQNADRFLDSVVQELTLSGKDVCKCEDPSPTTVSNFLRRNSAIWHKQKRQKI